MPGKGKKRLEDGEGPMREQARDLLARTRRPRMRRTQGSENRNDGRKR